MSLRTRLTVLYTSALAAVLAISAFLVVRVQLRAMDEEFDERLLMTAGVVDYAVRDRVVDAGLRVAASDLLLQLRFADVGVAVAAGDGGAAPVFTGSDPQLARGLSSTTCRNAGTSRRMIDGEPYRVLVRCIAVAGVNPGLTVLIGAAESPLVVQHRRLLGLLALTMIAGLALTAVAGHWMSGKALAPIRDMTTSVQQIGAEQLDQRLPVRPGDGEIADLSAVINALFDRLAQLVTRERRFLANAAHALRTPVAVLRAEVSEASDHPSSPDGTARQMAEVSESVDHLSRTVEYLLSLARRDSGTEIPVTERMYLDDVASGVVARLGRVFSARNVAVQWGRLDETPVMANTQVADQVIQILLENAAQYSPAGGVVTVSVHPTGPAHGELVVEDDGPGLTDEDRETLFTPFVRGSAARASGARGTGLGLAVAQWLVEGAGGTILVERRSPTGTRFVVRFPT
jgi:signal transduction histidine kinase